MYYSDSFSKTILQCKKNKYDCSTVIQTAFQMVAVLYVILPLYISGIPAQVPHSLFAAAPKKCLIAVVGIEIMAQISEEEDKGWSGKRRSH